MRSEKTCGNSPPNVKEKPADAHEHWELARYVIVRVTNAKCLVSCDHIPRRSWPLFRAKAMLGDLIAGFSSPGIQSQQEQLAA